MELTLLSFELCLSVCLSVCLSLSLSLSMMFFPFIFPISVHSISGSIFVINAVLLEYALPHQYRYVCVFGLARVSLIAELTAVSCLGLRLGFSIDFFFFFLFNKYILYSMSSQIIE